MSQPQTAAPHPELATAMRALPDAGRGELRSTDIAPRARMGDAPLSFAQERFWFLDRLQPGLASCNLPGGWRLDGPLLVPLLERALGEVVRRHESLRTTFREVDGVPVQVIHPFTGFILPVKDISHLAGEEQAAEERRLSSDVAVQPFDLRAGPVFRACLIRLADEAHALVTCTHHIAADGWSMTVLFREMWAAYAAFRAGVQASVPEPALQYADYAVWQREQWQGENAREQLAYWKEQLAGAPELLELPADHARPPLPSFRGGTVPVHAPPAVLGGLRTLALAEGATLYMVALAAFQVLLGRYAETEDVLVGTSVPGRPRKELEGVIGPFANTLVLRTDLSGDPTLREVVRRVRARAVADYAHHEVPFERLVAELQPERSLSHSPIFQVTFHLDDFQETGGAAAAQAPGPAPAPAVPEEPRKAAARVMDVEAGTTRFDLSLALQAEVGGIFGGLRYSVDLFERATVQRMAEHLQRVLAQAAADPDRPVSRLELAGELERTAIAGWNRTAAAYPADRCIHQLFEAQAARTPDAVAVTFGGASLTFRELDARANRLARHLAGLRVGPEVRVGLCLERSLEMMTAILGVMKAGGAYVPVDPAHPAERIGYTMSDSGVSVLLTQARLREGLPALEGVRVVCVDTAEETLARESAEPVESGVTSENLCYVIYTSGSTGRPKGVAMHHRGVVNYIHWGIPAYGADQGSGAPVFSSMAVDLTITNLLPLFAGRPVHLLPEASPVEALAEVLRTGPAFGLIKITPVHLALLNDLLEADELAAAAKTLVIGADSLFAEPTVYWQENAPGVRLMNEYGPTETVVGCSAYLLPNGVHRHGPVPVGGPIQNLTFHVLDARMQPVPIGLPGELYIGGAGVARGYLGRPGLSAEKFVPDVFAEGGGARMYRTGDRARWLPGGDLMILGRIDHQVKVRGYRVELGEIETVLRRHESVRGALVVVREDAPGDRRLVAYVAGAADAGALREHLRRSLPEYMVPEAFVMLETLPQTATGKIDPKTLPVPEYRTAERAAQAPLDYLDAQLIRIWEDLLRVDGIGSTENFFDLGGDSYLGLRLLALVKGRLECDLPVSTLFAGPTVRQMAQAIRARKGTGASPGAGVVPLQPHGTLPPLFFVHPADRNVMAYGGLVRHLGTGRPAYGLRDVGHDMGRPLGQIATEHVAALRTVQPRGPYYLCGWGFGGLVAFEMALQLEAQGETVAFTGLVDTMSPVLEAEWVRQDPAELAIGVAGEVAARLGRGFSMRPEAVRGLPADEQVRRVVEELHAQGAASAEFDAAALAAQCAVVQDRYRSRAGYVPGVLAGTATLFRADEAPPGLDDFLARYGGEQARTLGWSRHSRCPVEVHPVPGSHPTMTSEPHVRALAQAVRGALAAARARTEAGAPAGV